MNKLDFLHIVSAPSNVDQGQILALDELTRRFPFCQIAHVIQAMAADASGSMLSNQKLRTAAVYISDRAYLKYLISYKPNQILANDFALDLANNQPIDKALEAQGLLDFVGLVQIQQQEADSQVLQKDLDSLINTEPTELEQAQVVVLPNAQAVDQDMSETKTQIDTILVLDILENEIINAQIAEPNLEDLEKKPNYIATNTPNSVVETDKNSYIILTNGYKLQTNTATKKQNINTEIAENIEMLKFNKQIFNQKMEMIEQQSFFSPLGLKVIDQELEIKTKIKTADPKTDLTPITPKYDIDAQMLLISSFIDKKRDFTIKNTVPLSHSSEPTNEDLSSVSMIKTHTLVSETLANLFEKQGKKHKAIEMYEKLCLKYPEKNTYFASQIQRLQSTN